MNKRSVVVIFSSEMEACWLLSSIELQHISFVREICDNFQLWARLQSYIHGFEKALNFYYSTIVI